MAEISRDMEPVNTQNQTQLQLNGQNVLISKVDSKAFTRNSEIESLLHLQLNLNTTPY